MDASPIHPSIDLKGRRILAVDDDRINLRIIGGILRHEGYELAEAASGEQALELYATFHPNLVLLDVMMPGIDDPQEDLRGQMRPGHLRDGEERGRRRRHGI
jgi:CheY-like chemotaxis protein